MSKCFAVHKIETLLVQSLTPVLLKKKFIYRIDLIFVFSGIRVNNLYHASIIKEICNILLESMNYITCAKKVSEKLTWN